MTAASPAVPVRVETHGQIPEGSEDLAVAKVGSLLRRHTARPVLSARVVLTMAADPAVERPAASQATVDINGAIIRVRAVGPTMRQAIGLMAARLRIRLGRTA